MISGGLGAEIARRIDELAHFTDGANLTRLYLSPAHRAAAGRVVQWMREAGMTARIDATGSVVGRHEGAAPGAPALILGSHVDTVRDAGRFDGNLGVVLAISVVARLAREGRRPSFAIEVVAFGDEEGVRFPSTLGGSRALAGRFEPKSLDERDSAGVTRRQALIDFGCDPDAISAEARDPAHVLGYLEVHIEQGPVLEAEGLPVGIVTAIAGASRGEIRVRGTAGHAGTVPMEMRRDALAAAAEMILAVEARGRATPGLVATVGRIFVPDGAANTVAGAAAFSLDVRAPGDPLRRAAVADLRAAFAGIALRRGVSAEVAIGYDAPAAACDPALVAALSAAVARRGARPRLLPSGAGHDAMAFGGRIPFAMLFVRCKGGISHDPAEWASPEDIDAAAETLADFIGHFKIESTEKRT